MVHYLWAEDESTLSTTDQALARDQAPVRDQAQDVSQAQAARNQDQAARAIPQNQVMDQLMYQPETMHQTRAPDQGQSHEYMIDGCTAVDDLVFAGLHATLDQQVLNILNDQDSLAAQRDRALREALAKANEMLEGDDSNSSTTEEECAATPEANLTPATCDEAADLEEGGTRDEAEGRSRAVTEDLDGFPDDDVLAARVLELPAALKAMVQNLSREVGPDEPLRPVGRVLHEVEHMLTVQSATGDSILELATLCVSAQRQAVGYIVDTMGPTCAPFYVIQLTNAKVTAKPGDEIFAVASAKIATVESRDRWSDDEDDPLEDHPVSSIRGNPSRTGPPSRANLPSRASSRAGTPSRASPPSRPSPPSRAKQRQEGGGKQHKARRPTTPASGPNTPTWQQQSAFACQPPPPPPPPPPPQIPYPPSRYFQPSQYQPGQYQSGQYQPVQYQPGHYQPGQYQQPYLSGTPVAETQMVTAMNGAPMAGTPVVATLPDGTPILVNMPPQIYQQPSPPYPYG